MKMIIILLSLGLGVFTSCLKINCEEAQKEAKDRECLLIIEKEISTSDPYLNAEGRSLETGEYCKCIDDDRWWVQYRDNMSVGDTLIKRKGELVFNIHKKDTILSFPWKCEGKIYK